ncbi:hypothetical protein [Haloarcula nitratireducens]|uniref:Uncharacterized protein n=1 Tax=Haloarcula nitratireducens TaxID=2487749 RepID=A0AAW4PIY5_9EURY|nr:hypothetical protein [Halomicroarcula nitratireducens]MBX0297954.1 hypothetical protein [Halomicroarcula nitratireducens]
MSMDDKRAAVEQLEAALNAADADSMEYHIRQALQYLHVEDERSAPSKDSGNDELR